MAKKRFAFALGQIDVPDFPAGIFTRKQPCKGHFKEQNTSRLPRRTSILKKRKKRKNKSQRFLLAHPSLICTHRILLLKHIISDWLGSDMSQCLSSTQKEREKRCADVNMRTPSILAPLWLRRARSGCYLKQLDGDESILH